MANKQIKIPLKLVAEFEKDPILVLPNDVFPWGIIIRDLIVQHRPELAHQLEEIGWQVMVVPGQRVFR